MGLCLRACLARGAYFLKTAPYSPPALQRPKSSRPLSIHPTQFGCLVSPHRPLYNDTAHSQQPVCFARITFGAVYSYLISFVLQQLVQARKWTGTAISDLLYLFWPLICHYLSSQILLRQRIIIVLRDTLHTWSIVATVPSTCTTTFFRKYFHFLPSYRGTLQRPQKWAKTPHKIKNLL